MEYQTILLILLVIISADFIFDNIIGYLNHQSSKKPIPAKLEGIYDEERYAKSQAYERVNYRFGLLTETISFVAMFAILYFGVFGWVDDWLRNYAQNELLLSLYFFAVVFFASDILTIPFQWYSTFVIEEKFGFNKSTIKTFISDKLKGICSR